MPFSGGAQSRRPITSSNAEVTQLNSSAVIYEPLVWTTRLQRWLAQAFSSVFPHAGLAEPDVETGEPFDAETLARR